MNKLELRHKFKAARASLSKVERADMSYKISMQILNTWNFDSKTISVFLPIKRLHEVDTSHLIKTLSEKNTLCAPVSDLETHQMEHYTFDQNSLVKNEWGIPEPKNGDHVSATEIDILIIPLLVADKKGNRLGFGKGFYDRFLERCRDNALFIGINYFEPIDQYLEAEKHDHPLDALITPDHIHLINDEKIKALRLMP